MDMLQILQKLEDFQQLPEVGWDRDQVGWQVIHMVEVLMVMDITEGVVSMLHMDQVMAFMDTIMEMEWSTMALEMVLRRKCPFQVSGITIAKS